MCLEAKCPVRDLVELRLMDLEAKGEGGARGTSTTMTIEEEHEMNELESSLTAVESEFREYQTAVKQFLKQIRAKAASGASGMVVFIADVNALAYELGLE
jgi:hypothetical protein